MVELFGAGRESPPGGGRGSLSLAPDCKDLRSKSGLLDGAAGLYTVYTKVVAFQKAEKLDFEHFSGASAPAASRKAEDRQLHFSVGAAGGPAALQAQRLDPPPERLSGGASSRSLSLRTPKEQLVAASTAKSALHRDLSGGRSCFPKALDLALGKPPQSWTGRRGAKGSGSASPRRRLPGESRHRSPPPAVGQAGDASPGATTAPIRPASLRHLPPEESRRRRPRRSRPRGCGRLFLLQAGPEPPSALLSASRALEGLHASAGPERRRGRLGAPLDPRLGRPGEKEAERAGSPGPAFPGLPVPAFLRAAARFSPPRLPPFPAGAKPALPGPGGPLGSQKPPPAVGRQ